MLREHFGESAPFVILLRGPAEALDRQGPALVRALRRDPSVTTLSPWDRGAVQRLRPSPRRAIVIADFHVGIDEAVNETVPELNRILESTIHPPVRATQTGYATLSRAIQDDSIAATERGELIALPILLIVLLLVFRSPVAAAIPLAFGAVTVISSRGLLSILDRLVQRRRLRPRRLHDDGPGARRRLRPADGLALPRRAGGRGRRRRRRPARPAAPPAAPRSSPAAR